MNEKTMNLAAALAVLREDLAAAVPPPMRSGAAPARPQPAVPVAAAPALARPWRIPAWAGAATCVVLLVISAWAVLRPTLAPVPMAGARGGALMASLPNRPVAGAFVPVVSVERWRAITAAQGAAGVPAAAWLVASEMPQERLAWLGLPYDPSRAAETLRTELLLHPSGEVLAVRVLY